MNPLFQRLMQDATVLTRSGDLAGATAAIQAALAGGEPAPAEAPRTEPEAPNAPRFDAIDVPAREVSEPPAQATGERFVEGSHTGAAGRRDYRLYVPPGADGTPRPLIVMLHGCTQDAADFAAGTAMNELARAHGAYVLYPEQSRQANPQRCWNWFKHTHQGRERGEPALIAGMTREVMAQHAIDPAQVFVAGLSAGGAMAAIVGDAYPELFAAVGVHSGLPTAAARDLPSALAAMKSGPPAPTKKDASGVPTIVFHGDGDNTVHPSNGSHVIRASVAPGAQVSREQGVAEGGRRYTREVHRAQDGKVLAEHWVVHGAPHAWSGGTSAGSYTDPRGPDASAQMLRFFFEAARTRDAAA